MCGILGQISRTQKINILHFNEMRDTLRHRGPDGADTVLLNHGLTALGHRRLSIIDLSEAGKQPMCNEDGTVWLTYNGEIYNFHSLRGELLRLGHKFKSQTDSEVLVHGYEEWGIESLLERIKGMFAFALWDENDQKLFLARDRFGIKPLYYYRDKSQFIFASELKAITKSPVFKRELDESAVADFFIYSYVPNPKSIWKNTKKLAPAHYLVFDTREDGFELKRYWNLSMNNITISDHAAIEQANLLIRRSVEEHLVSDVPVGLFLSGGYDSSTLLMHMSDLEYPVHSYCIGFENSERSEEKQAASVAKTFGANHKTEVLDTNNSSFETLTLLSHYFDEPFAISSMIPYYYVSKLASRHNKVVMVGDGGDEAFGGYQWHYYIRGFMKKLTLKNQIKKGLFGTKKLLLQEYNNWMPGVSSYLIKRDVLQTSIKNKVQQQGLWLFNQNYLDSEDPVKVFQYLDFSTFIPEPCLTRADRSSMANSIEVRVPFLDHKIFEFMFNLDPNVYLKPGIKKYLIHRNLEGRIDPDILNMPKRGFSFQHLESLFSSEAYDLIYNGKLMENGIISKGSKIEDLSTIARFHLLILELWFRNHYAA